VQSVSVTDLAITVITVEEQLAGWYRKLRQSRKPHDVARAYQELADAVHALGHWRILTFGVPAIARYTRLTALRLNVGKMDLRISAVVLENGATLVTRNIRDFQRVPGLVLEDWAS
jgi:tRNA(fMet)-specific endonuclease VapC